MIADWLSRKWQALGPEPRAGAAEFLPAALEIIETPPSPAGRILAWTLMAFFAIALLWACIGSIDIIAIAQGRIVPSGRTKTIQPFETGVVRAIHVTDGQRVSAGDVLIEIDPTLNAADRDRLNAELTQARLDAARLRAIAKGDADPSAALVLPQGTTEEQADLQRQLLLSQMAEFKAKVQGLDRQIAQSEGNRAAVQSSIRKLEKSIPLLEQRVAMRKTLEKKGWESHMNVLTIEQDLVEHEQELEVQKGRLIEATEAGAALTEQRRQAEAEFKKKTLDDLAEAEKKTASLSQQLVQAAKKLKLQTLTAPVDGTVQQLAVHTEGGVVTPAQALLAIVPVESGLEIEANISNRDIGFVHAGEAAAIKVDTFNFTKYGLLSGRVVSVSQDSVARNRPATEGDKTAASGAESDSSEPKGQELVYTARIALDQTQMPVDGRMVNLTPGMAVTAEIKTGRRKIIDYLLSPLARHGQQAMRER
ncbi:HlyD family type I secretion periplasmic adaptor subunit [Bradyrhizobium sp. CCGUVB14]|uniref:HlyD family type I secretion periplasmic adaptor subunit n=1 Tax=Bradyrhizobium sp. CCGUVB14 TaxID=2949628 RepID=UPI0020B2585B|nr:HlyD family type I secretion periplasmic adaptor subunit [Bradyrhizobium sp. CCGUVB14]MCP3447324.1 HlyD family type I secretion periplasmic adaptor subunit [Bradyrhizobium sp. CCGUVB14]